MSPTIKNLLAILAGLLFGGAVNMGIVMLGSSVVPAPDGIDMTTMDGLKAGMHLMQPRHFFMPFLAHALGTFAGAWLAAMIAFSYKMRFAFSIGIFFLVGGIMNIIMLPSPIWFTIVDLSLAYIPMGYFGGRAGIRKEKKA